MSVETEDEIIGRRLWKNKTLTGIASDLLRIIPSAQLLKWESASLPQGATVAGLIDECEKAQKRADSKKIENGLFGITLCFLFGAAVTLISHGGSLLGLGLMGIALLSVTILFCCTFGLNPYKDKAYKSLRISLPELEKLKADVLAFNPHLALGGDLWFKQKMFTPESAKLQLALFALKVLEVEARYDEIRLSKERRVIEMRQVDLDLQLAQSNFERAFAVAAKLDLEASKEEAFRNARKL